MTLSIIVPVYQVEHYIRECILSILKIDDISYEIIIVDDGSTDQSIANIRDIIDSNNKITLIQQSNQGLSAARNKGLEYAKGKYVWFVDSDDIIDYQGLKKIINDCDGEDVLIGNYYRLYSNNSKMLNHHEFTTTLHLNGKEALRKYYLKNINTIVWRCIYRREFIKKQNLKFLERITYEDVEWTPRVLYFAKTVLYSSVPIYYYRIRSNSIVKSQFTTKKLNDILSVANSLEDFKNENKLNNQLRSVIDKSATYFLLLAYRKAVLANLSFNQEEIFQMIQRNRYKGSKYKILLTLRPIFPTIFNKILSIKFDKL